MASPRYVGSALPVEISEGGAIAPVRVVTTTNITLAGSAPDTYDGITLVANDRILVAGQTVATENGLYIVSVLGTGADGTWVRSADGNLSEQYKSAMPIWVSEGTLNQRSLWYLATANPITLGVTSLSFIKYQSFQYKSVNMAYNLDPLDSIIGVDTTAAVAITLPLASSVTAGRLFFVKDITQNAATMNITLNSNPADNIDGNPSFTINIDAGGIVLWSDSVNTWYVQSSYLPLSGGPFQPLDAGLTSISALVTGADTMIYTTALDTYTTTSLTAAGRAILDDASSEAQRITLGSIGVLSTTNAIDGNVVATTNLYTVPIGRTAVITEAIVRLTAANTATVGATAGIGVAAGEDDIFAAVPWTGMTTVGECYRYDNTNSKYVTVAAGGIIKLGIDTGYTATSSEVSVDLIGYLI